MYAYNKKVKDLLHFPQFLEKFDFSFYNNKLSIYFIIIVP